MPGRRKRGKGDTPSRAARKQKADRIALIVGMMIRFEWRTGESGPELAKVWGCATGTVEGYASEASRVVLSAFSDDEIRMQAIAGLQTIAKAAHAAREYSNATKALVALAEMAGVAAPSKVAITNSKGLDVVETPFLEPLFASPALAKFFTLHDRLPTAKESAELLSGARKPTDPV